MVVIKKVLAKLEIFCSSIIAQLLPTNHTLLFTEDEDDDLLLDESPTQRPSMADYPVENSDYWEPKLISDLKTDPATELKLRQLTDLHGVIIELKNLVQIMQDNSPSADERCVLGNLVRKLTESEAACVNWCYKIRYDIHTKVPVNTNSLDSEFTALIESIKNIVENDLKLDWEGIDK